MSFSLLRIFDRGTPRKRQSPGRLGREIFALAGIAAAAPMLVIAAIMLYQSERAMRAQADAALQDMATRYGQEIQDRLIGISNLLQQAV